ncbi:hypothetical protein [uncultured Kordia sp.]|uniref:hypothetical protein n=1 Tax=uncultured Kordia sp. TaxID=507699 RepID=UPI0026252F27|nr:hypothetical protein [uncultured Kordia sp.]
MKKLLCIFFCLLSSHMTIGQTISEEARVLKRKKAAHYIPLKERFISVHTRQNTYTVFSEKFKLYRRKIIADISLRQFSGKTNNLQNVADIVPYDFDKLQHKKFVAYIGNHKYELYQFNKEFFILEEFHTEINDLGKKEWKSHKLDVLPFTFINLKGKRKILTLINQTHQNYIIPKKDTLVLKVWTRYQGLGIVLLDFIQTQSYTPIYDSKKLRYISSHLFQLDKYYHIITKKKKKYLYNYRDENVLHKSYDSIILGSFIIGIKNEKYDVYNQTLKKLKLPNLQAAYHNNNNRYNLQIIQHNKLKCIPLSNDTTEVYTLSNHTPPYMPQLTLEMMLKIEERADTFAFIHEFSLDTLSISKSGIKDIYFLENEKKEIITNHYSYIIAALNNGKYSMLDIRNPTSYILNAVDEIKRVGNYICYKKDNVYGYYGIHQNGRFKKLDAFQGFFARFELPNGQKGWLNKNGKEYVDIH